MSSLTSLYGGGGGGTPVNSIAQLYVGGQTQYTDEAGGVWLKTGNIIVPDSTTYPDAFTTQFEDLNDNKPISSQFISGSTPYQFAFSKNGTRLTIIQNGTDELLIYNLSTPYDVTTIDAGAEQLISSFAISPRGIAFSNDEKKMYIANLNPDEIYELSVNVSNGNISSLTPLATLSVTSQQGTPTAINFNNDGTKLFVAGAAPGGIFEYTLSTAFDLSTATYSNNSFLITEMSSVTGFSFNSYGTKLYITNDNSADKKVYQYSLSTAFDLSTVSYDNISADFETVGVAFREKYAIVVLTELNRIYIMDDNRYISEYEYISGDYMGLGVNTGDYDYVKLK